jgi:hypothetical protein
LPENYFFPTFMPEKIIIMKVLKTLLIASLISRMAHATTITVCSNTAYPAQYSTIQDAINVAATGDTIYIYPGTYSESPTFNKRLTLIGPGVDPRRPNRLPAKITGNLIINGSAGSGSVLMGLYLMNSTQIGNSNYPVDNLVVTDCLFYSGNSLLYGNNILLENCILFSTYSTGSDINFQMPNAIGTVIQNNYIHGAIRLNGGTNTIIRNNIFASGDANTYSFSEAGQQGQSFGIGVRIQNNIFYKSDPIGPRSITDVCQYQKNIYYLTNDPTPANGQSFGNINVNPLFVNFPVAGAGFSFDYDFHLLAGSQGIGYGIDGKDLGMWGGSEPVNAGFEPPIPRIYDFQVNNSTVPVGGTIQLTIKATRAQ